MRLGNNEKNKNPPKVSKKRDKRSPNSTRKARKCNGRLMYKAKGVEPSSKVEMNKRYKQGALEVLTQYNPQTLFEPV